MQNFSDTKNNPQDLSLREVTNSTEPTGGKVGTHFYNNIPYRSIVVNPELPHISSLYEGLTPWQTGRLDKALKTGLSKTNMKAGSLESLNKVKLELGEMISKAQATDRPGGRSSVNIFVFI